MHVGWMHVTQQKTSCVIYALWEENVTLMPLALAKKVEINNSFNLLLFVYLKKIYIYFPHIGQLY